ncbi:MAG: 4-alpha-glucanotransferase [Elusimicrobia bacterium]|nr:4-alpha-glucanotransferase [Elusimicrobiota bacterium]
MPELPRSSGVLCHISSLPSAFGIGDLGPEAYRFADFLARAGQTWWQMLPISPTDPALKNSPYNSFSAFAGNPLFISPQKMVEDGWLDAADIEEFAVDVGPADHEAACRLREAFFEKAFRRCRPEGFSGKDLLSFQEREAYWLDDFALFVVLKETFGQTSWSQWPQPLRDRDPRALADFVSANRERIERVKFIQYLFDHQWRELRGYCSTAGVRLVGDIPIYVSYDSADVWAAPQLFELGPDRAPKVVAGVPPDYFSADGQRWGNPLYDWDRMRDEVFAWWVARFRRILSLFDRVRVDHFRAFAQCWEIPASEKTAVNGVWKDVPGAELFTVLCREFPGLPVIAEDLGIITPDVDALKNKFSFPGMRVLLFAFHNEYRKSRDLPENYDTPSVVYTGTHDNNTVRGWYEHDMTEIERKNAEEYFGCPLTRKDVHLLFIRAALESRAEIAILSLQDILGLGQKARMNKPSTVEGNWIWRFPERRLTRKLSASLKEMSREAGR